MRPYVATVVLLPMDARPYLHLPNACMHGRWTPIQMDIISSQLCRTGPRWDLLTEPGQHGSVRLFKCKHFYNHANGFQSDKRATSGRAKFGIVSRKVLRVSYERFLFQRYDRQRVDRQRSALPH